MLRVPPHVSEETSGFAKFARFRARRGVGAWMSPDRDGRIGFSDRSGQLPDMPNKFNAERRHHIGFVRKGIVEYAFIPMTPMMDNDMDNLACRTKRD